MCVWLFKLDVTVGVIVGAGLFALSLVNSLVQALVKRAKAA